MGCIFLRDTSTVAAEVAQLADFVDSTVKDIDKRLSELKVEVTKL